MCVPFFATRNAAELLVVAVQMALTHLPAAHQAHQPHCGARRLQVCARVRSLARVFTRDRSREAAAERQAQVRSARVVRFWMLFFTL